MQLTGRVQALGLSLKSEKTAVTHIDEGFLFLGQWSVRRPTGSKRYVYTFVSNEALASVRRKVRALTALHEQPGAVRADRSAQPGPAGLGKSLPPRRG